MFDQHEKKTIIDFGYEIMRTTMCCYLIYSFIDVYFSGWFFSHARFKITSIRSLFKLALCKTFKYQTEQKSDYCVHLDFYDTIHSKMKQVPKWLKTIAFFQK